MNFRQSQKRARILGNTLDGRLIKGGLRSEGAADSFYPHANNMNFDCLKKS